MKLFIHRRFTALLLTFAVIPMTLSLFAFINSDSSDVLTEQNGLTFDNAGKEICVKTNEKAPDGSGMVGICQNNSQILFANMSTGEFAVKDVKKGHIWYSNPPDRENDEFMGSDRANVFSAITLHCLNTETMVDEYINSFGSVVMDDNATVKEIESGIETEYYFKDFGITIPLKIELTSNGFKASVDVSSVKEEGTFKTMDISVLPYFGAGGVNDDGYMVVPDGSGGLIHFNNGKQGLLKYSNYIYGSNAILSGEEKGINGEFTALPLFGLKNGNNGFAAVITEGDAVASVNAGVSKAGSGYNNIYAGFTLRSSGSDIIGGKTIRTYEKGKSRIKKCEITYSFLPGDEANYVGVANVYRKHLEKQMKTSVADTRRVSVFLELYGAIRVKKSVLGFPAKVIEPLTTFEQAEQIAGELKEIGIDNILLSYQNADTDSLKQTLPSSYSPNSKLGGKKGYKKLNDRLTEWNIPLISNINFTTFQNSGNGYSVRTDTAELFTGLPGLRYPFKLNTGEKDNDKPITYFLAPDNIKSATEKFAEKYIPESFGNIGLDTAATDIYSDFSGNGVSRQEMLGYLADALSELSEKTPLYMRTGNGRLIPYASYIYDLPDSSSHFDLVDESVPLYPIAISGLVPYSLKSVNSETDNDRRLLKCAEYGADLKFNFSYKNFGIIGDSSFGYLNGTVYELWKDYAGNAYKRLSVLNGQTGNGKIIDHRRLADNLYLTSYENGAEVVVNYNEDAAVYKGVTVKGRDFTVIKGGKAGD